MTQHHTPGPWTVSEPTGVYIQSAAGGIAALTYSAKEADARLIAAAPDLLDALAFLEPHLNALPIFEYERLKIRAAIAKATGA